jgi:hypothetical protein
LLIYLLLKDPCGDHSLVYGHGSLFLADTVGICRSLLFLAARNDGKGVERLVRNDAKQLRDIWKQPTQRRAISFPRSCAFILFLEAAKKDSALSQIHAEGETVLRLGGIMEIFQCRQGRFGSECCRTRD